MIKKINDQVIIKKVNDYLKGMDMAYEALYYARLNNKYIFTYMARVNNPKDFLYTEIINNNYYAPVVDNNYIEYDINTGNIRMINISSNFDMINKLKFLRVEENTTAAEPKLSERELKSIQQEKQDKTYTSNKLCPHCHNRLVPIIYGMVEPDLEEKARRKEAFIGGDVEIITEYIYDWYCYKCDYSFTKDLKHNDHEDLRK